MKEKLPGNNSDLEKFRPFYDIDLIVSDIDGTLISGTDPVFIQIKKLIKNLKKQNVYLTIATGRTFFGTRALLQELDIKIGMPIALYNGSVVIEYGTENVLYANFVKIEDVLGLMKKVPLDNVNLYMYTFGINANIFQNKESMIIERVYGIGPDRKKYDVNGLEISWVKDIKMKNFSINAILIEKKYLSIEETKQIKDYLDGIDSISYTDSGNGFLEIKASGLNKGIIFEILKKQTKFKINKCLAIGDNDNDKELFEYSDLSVAVANSSILAIEEADYICENDSAKGFLDMLNAIKIAKKYYNN